MGVTGERLRRLRQARRLSSRQLEKLAEIPHGIVSRLERDERAYPSVPVAMRLARVLGVSLDYICGMDQESESEPATTAPVLA